MKKGMHGGKKMPYGKQTMKGGKSMSYPKGMSKR